jgi:hypothetical protein
MMAYPRSSLAEPPITTEEAQSVDLATDTTVCRRHGGRLTHLNAEGAVYFCPVGQQLWRYSKQLNEFLRPLHYQK